MFLEIYYQNFDCNQMTDCYMYKFCSIRKSPSRILTDPNPIVLDPLTILRDVNSEQKTESDFQIKHDAGDEAAGGDGEGGASPVGDRRLFMDFEEVSMATLFVRRQGHRHGVQGRGAPGVHGRRGGLRRRLGFPTHVFPQTDVALPSSLLRCRRVCHACTVIFCFCF